VVDEKRGLRQYDQAKKVDWTITPRIRELAYRYMGFHELREITNRTVFECTMFSVLAARQDYGNHVKIYANLLANGYGDPFRIIEEQDTLNFHRMLAGASGPNQKRERLAMLAEWWVGSKLPDKVIADVTNGQKKEFRYRDCFATEAPGVAHKGASMLFGHIGYRNVVPIDTWMQQYLQDHGHLEFPRSDYITVGGYGAEEYKKAEAIMAEDAKKQGIKPYMFQVMLWIAATGWTPKDYVDPKTIDVTSQQQIWDKPTLEETINPLIGIPKPPVLMKRHSKMSPQGGRLKEPDETFHEQTLF